MVLRVKKTHVCLNKSANHSCSLMEQLVLVNYLKPTHLGAYPIITRYCKDTEPLYHSFMYSLVSLLSSIYPLPECIHCLLHYM